MAATRVPVWVIDDVIELRHLIGLIWELRTDPPALYIDVHGEKLERGGSISFITIYSPMIYTVCIIDVQALGAATFDTPASTARKSDSSESTSIRSGMEMTLRTLFQRKDIPKVFFDVRQASDALYDIYDVKLDGVIEIQLLEFAISGRETAESLEHCVTLHAHGYFDKDELEFWKETNERGENALIENLGIRPLDKVIELWCANRVLFMPCLYHSMNYRLTDGWGKSVLNMSRVRIMATWSPYYIVTERHNKNPWRYLEFLPSRL